MKKITGAAQTRRSLLLCFVILALAAWALLALPSQFSSEAFVEQTITEDRQKTLENYDIRTDKTEAETLLNFRQAANRSAVEIADARDRFVAGEARLRSIVPTLKVEYNEDLRTPEVIAPDVAQGRAFLTQPSQIKRSDVLRNFVKNNNLLIGLTDKQASRLKLTADYTNPDGELSFVHYDQTINGVPVFRGEIKAGFTKNGEMIRVINNLAPELDEQRTAIDFRNPLDAVRSPARHINYELKASDTELNETVSTDLKTVFGTGDFATTAEKMYFPTEPGVARAAWRVLIWQPVYSYYVIVDAETGTMLWRKCITEEQTQAATYNVYANQTSFLRVLDNPAPMTPGPIDPALGTQGTVQARTNVTLIGNEAPFTFNNNGWINDGANGTNGWTDGNAVQAGVDRVAPNGVDAVVSGTNRTFNFAYNPAPGNPAPGDDPLGAEFQKGAATQMFYVMNRYHDEMYLLGFTEAARNFQHDNFGRGGNGADRVSAEGQDSSGTNNANFSTPADGGRGVMQMYLWNAPTPDYDGTIDADIIIHEVTHGLSNRLHGNSAGLTSTMSRGMGEGWGDFYGHAMLSEPTDPIEGIYTTGGYATYLGGGAAGNNKNYYYGIRRFPKAVKSFVGPNGKPHNPLSFRHLNSNCNTEIGTAAAIGTISAYPRGPFGSTQCDQVHAAGEIWSSALWEVRAKLITTHGWATGNRRVLQYVTDGMKLAPIGPTFLQERDAILAAAQATGGGTDVGDVWAGFAVRGMGFSARVISASPANVTEAFDLPNIVQTPTFTFTDAGGNNNGFADPGETLQLSIPLSNNTGSPAIGTTLQVIGGGTADYGTIANNQTVTRAVNFTVPAGTQCGSVLTITLNINSSLGPKTETRSLVVGEPITTYSENFDTVTAPALPTGWTSTIIAAGLGFRTATTAPDTAPNSAFVAGAATGGGSDLTSPEIPITSAAAVLTFRHRYDLQTTFDGATLEIKIGGGAFQNIETAGGVFSQGGFQITLSGTSNPLSGQRGWNGNSNGYITSSVQLPASANNQNVQFRFRIGHNINTVSAGWNIDNIQVRGGYTCDVVSSAKVRADFDGDGKTDFSVFRPAEGNWYLNRSTAGFTALGWGLGSDILTPGDFDGDGKTDVAVARRQFPGMTFYILNSGNSAANIIQWGATNDVPQIGDYDGDGKADIAVYRFSNGTWYVRLNTGANYAVQFGAGFDVPVANDYDGDGKTDVAVYRSSVWYIQRSQLGFVGVQFGASEDKLVPADYDGDGKTDIAVFRPSNGTWYLQRSNLGFVGVQFGQTGDVPVPGDYDGDGKSDVAVFRGGTWYVMRSTSGFLAAAFGNGSDAPIPKQYIP